MLKKFGAIVCSIAMTISCITVANGAQPVNVELDGNLIEFETAQPIIKDNRTLIPLRGLFEKMDYEISWNANLKAAVLSKDGNTISIRNDKEYIVVNGIQKEVDVPAQIIDEYMMIPLRAVADSTGALVNWDAENKTAQIIFNNKSDYVLSVNDYSTQFNQIIEPLEMLKTVAAGLNSLNSDTSDKNVKAVSSQLKDAKELIDSVRKQLDALIPPDNFVTSHDIALTALSEQSDLCDVLISAITGKTDYAKAKVQIDEYLNVAKKLNERTEKISFKFN